MRICFEGDHFREKSQIEILIPFCIPLLVSCHTNLLQLAVFSCILTGVRICNSYDVFTFTFIVGFLAFATGFKIEGCYDTDLS